MSSCSGAEKSNPDWVADALADDVRAEFGDAVEDFTDFGGEVHAAFDVDPVQVATVDATAYDMGDR